LLATDDRGQQHLFDQTRYLFYITNVRADGLTPSEVAFEANDRCNQEHLIEQLKNGGAGAGDALRRLGVELGPRGGRHPRMELEDLIVHPAAEASRPRAAAQGDPRPMVATFYIARL